MFTTLSTRPPTKSQLLDEITALAREYRGNDLPFWSMQCNPLRHSTRYLIVRRDDLRQAIELKARGEKYKALLYFCGDHLLLDKMEKKG